MSITVQKGKGVFTLRASDIQDGLAYESVEGVIFIGNSFENVKAYSLDGYSIVNKHDSTMCFREVDLQISVL